MNTVPRRYRISSWRQLPECTSNNSKKLHIYVSDYIHNPYISGMRISVEHEVYGCLFSCILRGRGSLVTLIPDSDMSVREVLLQLAKFGFFIDYDPRDPLAGDQLSYLMTLKDLHFDKLRVLAYSDMKDGAEIFTKHIVAFNSEHHSNWLNNDYCPRREDYMKSLLDGSAVNLTGISETRKYDWAWLDYVADINDIIEDQAVL